MRYAPVILLLLLSTPCFLGASDFGKTNPGMEVEEDENKYLRQLEEEAAKFRLHRVTVQMVAADDEAAKIAVAEGTKALAAQDWKKARKVANKAFKRYKFSASTTVAGDLKRIHVIAAANLGKILETRQELGRLWLYFPDYAEVSEAMMMSLVAAEKAQAFTSIVHLERDRPSEVIDVNGSSQLAENDKLFRFLATYGDRVTVAPRAELGIARSSLLTRDPTAMRGPQDSYERFLTDHPRHELSFIALTELALSHLVTYAGPEYDVGALAKASGVIDLADTETRGDPQRVALVQAYRARIRSWFQDRDLTVARWYADRHRPPWLSWLKDPSTRDWDTAARFYYQEVIKRDPASTQARAATRELEQLKPLEEERLGGDVPAGKP